MSEYSERYCAFVDILGFARLVESLPEGGNAFHSLRSLLERVHRPQPSAVAPAETDFRAQSISDAVAISSHVSGAGLLAIMDALEQLSLDLLCQGYFVRGGLVKGPLYHDEHMVFGQALVRAYHIEQDTARYPRIVVTREVREDVIHYTAKAKPKEPHPRMDRLKQSEDGPMFLDILGPVAKLAKKSESLYANLSANENADLQHFSNISTAIQLRYEESMDTPRHFEKVRWMARYWNDTIPANIPRFPRLRGAALDRNTRYG